LEQTPIRRPHSRRDCQISAIPGRRQCRQAALPEFVADTRSDFPEVQRLRKDLIGRDALHASLQQGVKRPALVGDLHQRPEGVEADGLDLAHVHPNLNNHRAALQQDNVRSTFCS
jgi:hypothetical protein